MRKFAGERVSIRDSESGNAGNQTEMWSVKFES
jgi:hypothetical protein